MRRIIWKAERLETCMFGLGLGSGWNSLAYTTQRLTTGPEQTFAREEVTNYVKPKGWRMIGRNASEGIEPRNFHRRIGPKVIFPGSQHRGVR